jgi:O-antigen/teichoic acid export membrane protein
MSAMLALSIGITITVFVYADLIVQVMFGPAFVEAGAVLRVLVFTMTLVYNECVTAALLYATGRQVHHLKCVALGAGSNLVANFILIPRFGMYGAAVATIIAEVFVFSSLMFYARGAVKWSLQPFVRAIFPVVLVSPAIWLLPPYFGSTICAAVAFATGGMIALRRLRPQ